MDTRKKIPLIDLTKKEIRTFRIICLLVGVLLIFAGLYEFIVENSTAIKEMGLFAYNFVAICAMLSGVIITLFPSFLFEDAYLYKLLERFDFLFKDRYVSRLLEYFER